MTKDIGVKNTYAAYKTVLLIAFLLLIFPVVILWIVYYCDCESNKFVNGIEVEAVIVNRDKVAIYDDDGDYLYSVWEYVYQYVAPEGKVYRGTTRHSNLAIGDSITIVINPETTDSTDRTLSDILSHKNDAYRDFTLACVFSGLFCISAYLFFYRVVYRTALDKRILKHYGNSYFISNSIIEGEVIKTYKWIVGYIKVRYRDERDLVKEKWARSWFTRSEVKFLEQKQYINILPYKNSYGVVEEMPYEAKQKKTKRQ